MLGVCAVQTVESSILVNGNFRDFFLGGEFWVFRRKLSRLARLKHVLLPQLVIYTEHVSGAENGADRAENRVERSRAERGAGMATRNS